MNKDVVINSSNVDNDYLYEFYNVVNSFDDKIKLLVASVNYKFVLANKHSDVFSQEQIIEHFSDISKYKEHYNSHQIDEIFRGICSDVISSICVFSNTTKIQQIKFVLYHETAHFLDFYNGSALFEKFFLSTNPEFVNAYKNDLKIHWSEIKADRRFRLIHYIQDSTPENPSPIAMAETFASCFSKIHNGVDETDFIGLYFKNATKAADMVVKDFLNNC